jgi:MFS superfamily sulfate permease-like transporter
MLSSALNFALGFFGYPVEGKYQQSITIEASGVRVQFFGIDRSQIMLTIYSLITPLLLMIRSCSYLTSVLHLIALS